MVIVSLLILVTTILTLFTVLNFETNRLYTIEDEWAFYPNEFLTTSDGAPPSTSVNLPHEFTDQPVNYATYIKNIQFDESQIGQVYAFHLPYQYSAAKLYLNEQLLFEAGTVGDATQHQSDLRSDVVPFTVTETTMEIALQISSYEHIRAGFANPIQMGEYVMVEKSFVFERLVVAFLAGVIFLVGLVTVLIGIYRKEEQVFFLFGLFCFLVAVRAIFGVPFVYQLLPIHMSYVLATRIEYISTITVFLLYMLFIAAVYKQLFAKWLVYCCYGVWGLVVSFTIFTQPIVFQAVFFHIFPFISVVIVYLLYIVLRAIREKLDLALPILIGIGFVFLGLVLDFASGAGVLYIPPLSLFTIAINVSIIVCSLSANYVAQLDTIRHLNDELQRMNTSLNTIVYERTLALHEANETLSQLVERDNLTGLYNRRKLNEYVTTLERQLPISLAVMILDIDEFKKYNDFYGHLKGDELLKQFATLLQQALPTDMLSFRYGGEEFVVILEGHSVENAYSIAERIRVTIEQAHIPHVASERGILTVSIGLATNESDLQIDPMKLLQIADNYLYSSKHRGRNQITVKQ